jgi:hypothetical protein
MGAVEILGFIAGLTVLASFVLKGEFRIRLANSVGAALFAIYGVLLGAWAIWFVNVALIIIHIVYLIKKPNGKEVVLDPG